MSGPNRRSNRHPPTTTNCPHRSSWRDWKRACRRAARTGRRYARGGGGMRTAQPPAGHVPGCLSKVPEKYRFMALSATAGIVPLAPTLKQELRILVLVPSETSACPSSRCALLRLLTKVIRAHPEPSFKANRAPSLCFFPGAGPHHQPAAAGLDGAAPGRGGDARRAGVADARLADAAEGVLRVAGTDLGAGRSHCCGCV